MDSKLAFYTQKVLIKSTIKIQSLPPNTDAALNRKEHKLASVGVSFSKEPDPAGPGNSYTRTNFNSSTPWRTNEDISHTLLPPYFIGSL